VAAGYPGGFASDPDDRGFQATDGTLSQTAASIEGTALEPDVPDALQHQAPIRPGMSGGPTMNDKGEVIGLTMASSADARDQNLNVAISSKRIQQLLPDLESGKNTGYVGWSELFTEPFGDRRALVVGRVKSGSPADKREIRGGDVIVSLDDTPVASYPEMCSILNSKSSGDSLKVEVVPTSVWGRWLRSPESDLGAFLGRQRTVTKSVTLE
jgi:S1-C subfamily serine protease